MINLCVWFVVCGLWFWFVVCCLGLFCRVEVTLDKEIIQQYTNSQFIAHINQTSRWKNETMVNLYWRL